MRYAAPRLMLLVFLAVIVMLAAASGFWRSFATTTRPPRPFVNSTPPALLPRR